MKEIDKKKSPNWEKIRGGIKMINEEQRRRIEENDNKRDRQDKTKIAKLGKNYIKTKCRKIRINKDNFFRGGGGEGEGR